MYSCSVKRNEPQIVHSFRERTGPAACALPVFVCWVFFLIFLLRYGLILYPTLPRTCDSPCLSLSVLQQSATKPALHAVFSALPPLSSFYLYRSARRYGACLPHCREKWDAELESRSLDGPSSSAAKPVRDSVTAQMSFSTEQCAVHICVANLCF